MDFSKKKTLLFSDGKEVDASPLLQEKLNSAFISDNDFDVIPIQYDYTSGSFNVFGIEEEMGDLLSIISFHHYIGSSKGVMMNLLLLIGKCVSSKESNKPRNFTHCQGYDLKLYIKRFIDDLSSKLEIEFVGRISHFLILNVLLENYASSFFDVKQEDLYKNSILFSKWYSFLCSHCEELRDGILSLDDTSFLRKMLFSLSYLPNSRNIIDTIFVDKNHYPSPNLIIETEKICSDFLPNKFYWDAIKNLGIAVKVHCELCAFSDDDRYREVYLNIKNMKDELEKKQIEEIMDFAKGKRDSFAIHESQINDSSNRFGRDPGDDDYDDYCRDRYNGEEKYGEKIFFVSKKFVIPSSSEKLYDAISKAEDSSFFFFENPFFKFLENKDNIVKIYNGVYSEEFVEYNTFLRKIIRLGKD